VEVLVDGAVLGNATYGISRPDIPAAFRGATANSGFSYSWDTVKFVNGSHALSVRITDENGNIAILPTAYVTVSNP
jgi:N-acetylmuramoyl-L-alanine amidase